MLAEEDPPTDIMRFHAQQCVEKFLKAFLTHRGVHVDKTHDLAKLLDDCCSHDTAFDVLRQTALNLTDYAVATRYTDFWLDIPPDEAGAAVEAASRTMAFVNERLGQA